MRVCIWYGNGWGLSSVIKTENLNNFLLSGMMVLIFYFK